MHGDVHAASQLGEALDGLQAAARLGRKRRERRSKQVTERLAIPSPHTSAQLMQLRQPELMSVIDDNRIGVRHVDAILDNGRGDQHIVLVVYEIENDPFQLFGFHLSVSDSHTHAGYFAAYKRLDLINVLDAVIDDERLSVAAHLELDRLTDDVRMKTFDLRLNRVTVRRRRCDIAQIARPHKRELKRTGNGRGREGERVDIRSQLAQLLLDRHAELLLLIDDQQPEVFELNIFAH